jgi:hypothetical protein
MLTTPHLAPALALALALPFHTGENLIRDGDGSSPGQWMQNGPAEIFALDGGVRAKHAVYDEHHGPARDQISPSSWRARVEIAVLAQTR